MNISPFDIYLISLVGNIKDALACICIVSAAVAIVCVVYIANLLSGIGIYLEDKSCIDTPKKALRISSLTFLVAFSLMVVLPSSKVLAAMYVIPAIANSEMVNKDIPEAGKALIEMATEWMRVQTKSVKDIQK